MFGLPGNDLLRAKVEAAADDIRTRRAKEQAAVLRGYTETTYAARSWNKQRRAVARIEATTMGLDIRFVVTSLRYACSRLAVNYGAPACQSLSGRALDAMVGASMLQVLEPAALEVSLQLAEDLELERAGLYRQWQQRLERARYEVERARRQYDAVEPENRLVVRTLEQRWETALADELRLNVEHKRFLAEQPLPLTPDEQVAIRRLAIARLMLERVILTVQGESELVLAKMSERPALRRSKRR